MNKTIAYCVLIVSFGVVVALSAAAPNILGDENEFLKNFVNHEILNVLGVILAITLASAGQLHLTLNSIEEKYKSPDALAKTRRGVQSAAFWLIGLFLVSIALVICKPIFCGAPGTQSMFNGVAIILLI